MKKPIAIIIGLCILGLLGASIEFQDGDVAVKQYLKRIEGRIGVPWINIEEEFGQPDKIGEQAVIWTYFIKGKGDAGKEEVIGYRQYGNWGGVLGCYGERNFTDELQALSLYQLALDYMDEEGRTITTVSYGDSLFDFTEKHRFARKLDHFWEVDASLQPARPSVTLFVYNHEKRGCYLELLDEADRIEKELGL